MKCKFYRRMKQLFVLGVVLIGCMAPLSVKAEATETDNGNGYYKMSEKSYTKNGAKWKLNDSNKYSYDKRGNLLNQIHTSRDSITYSTETAYEYKYDKKGNVLSKKMLIDNKLSYLDTYTYDKKGNVKTHKYYYYLNGGKKLQVSTKYTYKNGKLYKETTNNKAYGEDAIFEYIYRSDGTMKSSTLTAGSEQSKCTYDKYGNITKKTYSGNSVKFVDIYKNTYKNGVLSCVINKTTNTNSTSKRDSTTTYYTSGYRKGQTKKTVTQEYEKVNGKWIESWKHTTTYKYKADKTGKNVGEVTTYCDGKASFKTCYTWKKIKK